MSKNSRALYLFLDESYRVNGEVHSMSLLAARVSARSDCCSALHLLGLGPVEVGDQDARALLSKELGSGSTQALSRARDDGHLYHNSRPHWSDLFCPCIVMLCTLTPHVAHAVVHKSLTLVWKSHVPGRLACAETGQHNSGLVQLAPQVDRS